MKKSMVGSVMVMAVILLSIMVLFGCQPLENPEEIDESLLVQNIAESALVYDTSRSIETASADAEHTIGSKSLDAVSRALDDYAPQVITEEDLGNGTIRITRTWTSWNGIAMKSIITRMKTPSSTDSGWLGNPEAIVDNEATEKLYAGDFVNPVSTAQLTITWRKDGASVYMYSLLKEGERMRANGDFIKTYTEWDAQKRIVAKRIEYLRIGETVAARTIRYTYTYVDSDAIPEEIRFTVDGVAGYGIVVSVAEPRILELYRDMNGDNVEEKFMRIERVRDTESGELVTTRIRYNADGTEQARLTVRARIRMENGVVTVVRTLPDGRVFKITITETADGYTIDRNGRLYIVTVNDDGSLVITTPSGTVWLAVPCADGSWTVTQQ